MIFVFVSCTARDHGNTKRTNGSGDLACPLCAQRHGDRGALKAHLCQIHSVTSDGVNRLMEMVRPMPPMSNGPVHPAKSRAGIFLSRTILFIWIKYSSNWIYYLQFFNCMFISFLRRNLIKI